MFQRNHRSGKLCKPQKFCKRDKRTGIQSETAAMGAFVELSVNQSSRRSFYCKSFQSRGMLSLGQISVTIQRKALSNTTSAAKKVSFGFFEGRDFIKCIL